MNCSMRVCAHQHSLPCSAPMLNTHNAFVSKEQEIQITRNYTFSGTAISNMMFEDTTLPNFFNEK
jgi:hypothetical protein